MAITAHYINLVKNPSKATDLHGDVSNPERPLDDRLAPSGTAGVVYSENTLPSHSGIKSFFNPVPQYVAETDILTQDIINYELADGTRRLLIFEATQLRVVHSGHAEERFGVAFKVGDELNIAGVSTLLGKVSVAASTITTGGVTYTNIGTAIYVQDPTTGQFTPKANTGTPVASWLTPTQAQVKLAELNALYPKPQSNIGVYTTELAQSEALVPLGDLLDVNGLPLTLTQAGAQSVDAPILSTPETGATLRYMRLQASMLVGEPATTTCVQANNFNNIIRVSDLDGFIYAVMATHPTLHKQTQPTYLGTFREFLAAAGNILTYTHVVPASMSFAQPVNVFGAFNETNVTSISVPSTTLVYPDGTTSAGYGIGRDVYYYATNAVIELTAPVHTQTYDLAAVGDIQQLFDINYLSRSNCIAVVFTGSGASAEFFVDGTLISGAALTVNGTTVTVLPAPKKSFQINMLLDTSGNGGLGNLTVYEFLGDPVRLAALATPITPDEFAYGEVLVTPQAGYNGHILRYKDATNGWELLASSAAAGSSFYVDLNNAAVIDTDLNPLDAYTYRYLEAGSRISATFTNKLKVIDALVPMKADTVDTVSVSFSLSFPAGFRYSFYAAAAYRELNVRASVFGSDFDVTYTELGHSTIGFEDTFEFVADIPVPLATQDLLTELKMVRRWSYAIVNGDLFMYQQGLGHMLRLDKTTGSVTMETPKFLNLPYVLGITSAAGRLVAWDSDGAIYRSSIFDPLDFTPALATQATVHKIEAMRGAIRRILGMGKDYIVYATGSIHLAQFDPNTSKFRYTTLEQDSGIYGYTAVDSLDTSRHVAYTSKGLMLISSDGSVKAIDNVLSEQFAASQVPAHVRCIEGRYAMLQFDSASAALQKQYLVSF